MKQYIDEQAGIYLRLMTYEDTENIVNWRNSDAVRKNFIYQALFTRESHENWIGNREGGADDYLRNCYRPSRRFGLYPRY